MSSPSASHHHVRAVALAILLLVGLAVLTPARAYDPATTHDHASYRRVWRSKPEHRPRERERSPHEAQIGG